MSKENRLAAKKRTAQARRNRIIKRVVIVVLCLAVIAGIALIVRSEIIKKQSGVIDYSYVTDEGTLQGVDASKAVTLADYKNTGITLDQYLPTEKEITDSVNDMVTSIEESNNTVANSDDADAEDEDLEVEDFEDEELDDEDFDDEDFDDEDEDGEEEPEIDVDAILNDEWVEANVASKLADKYPHTVDGLRAYHKDNLQQEKIEDNMINDIYDYLVNNSTADYPTKLLNRFIWNRKLEDEAGFAQYSSMIGVATIQEYYSSMGADYDSMAESSAKNELMAELISLAIFEKEGLSLDKAGLKDFYNNNDYNGISYEDYIAEYSENYYYLQAKVRMVQDYLKGLIK